MRREKSCPITIKTDRIVHPKFGGVGFNIFHHWCNDEKTPITEDVINKRWKELNPSFARVPDRLCFWDKSTLDLVARTLEELKQTDTEVYLTTWYTPDVAPGIERAAYATRVADTLEYLVRDHDLTNLKYYCMGNELWMNGQTNKLMHDMPKFRDYHMELFKEFRKRNLSVQLLATDAAGLGASKATIPWAIENMDEITGIYGSHQYVGLVWGNYIEDYSPNDPSFYPWWLRNMQWYSRTAQKVGKNFVLGEYGIWGNYGTKESPLFRTHNDRPMEPMAALQLAEAVIGAINGGIYATCYWLFMDFPDGFLGSDTSTEPGLGMFKWSGTDHSTRASYYALGLLSKFFRGPATVFEVESADQMLRVAAVQHHKEKTYSIAVINRLAEEQEVTFSFTGELVDGIFRKYVYDPAKVPQHPFGDLPASVDAIKMEHGQLSDSIGGNLLTIYTTAYKDEFPVEVLDVRVIERLDDCPVVTWKPSKEPGICYYRVYRGESADFVPSIKTQIGSTRRTNWRDPTGNFEGRHFYRVAAVNQFGNVSPSKMSYKYKSILEGLDKQ